MISTVPKIKIVPSKIPKKNKPPHGSGNHTAAIYEVKKMKTEDGLFEERNNLLRQVGEEGRDFCKECNNRIHILAAA